MKKILTLVLCAIIITAITSSCSQSKISQNSGLEMDMQKVVGLNPAYFLTNSDHLSLTLVDCVLSNGNKTKCYKIISSSIPTDHQMGPWCPDNINDGPDKGGIWLEGGKVYDVDGSFIKNMSTFYGDSKWKMYDETGKIYKTRTKEECAAAARPDVDPRYYNHCVECLPSYVTDLTSEYLIPAKPQLMIGTPEQKSRKDRPNGKGRSDKGAPPKNRPTKGGGGMVSKGVALNGVRFDAPAPTNAILSAYTLAPFDDAGGHINLHAGYHYHAVTGQITEIAQPDNHAPLIGYAMDGVAMYALLDKDGKEPSGLDACRGHFDDVRGYHYHVNTPGSNNIIGCHKGAIAQ